MAEPLAELLGEPLMTLDLEALTRLRRSLGYVWARGQDVLYVGISGNGVERPLARGHETLRGFQAGDTLTIWPADDATATEVDLIRRLRPRFNGHGAFGNQGEPCPVCGGRWRLADRPAGRRKWCQGRPGTDPISQDRARRDRDAQLARLLREAFKMVAGAREP